MGPARTASTLLLASVALAAFAAPAGAVSIVNGSMDHTGGTNYLWFNGYVAPGWTQDNSGTNPLVYTTSPDILDPAITAYDMAWVPSPDGGMFAHGSGWIDGENQEGIYQTVTGLTVGEQYDVTFFQSISDLSITSSGIAGQWQVRFGTTTLYSDVMLAPAASTPYGWDLQVLSFVATATTQDLSFLAHSVDHVEPVYVGLDGVSIREATVPEPAAAALVGVALAGLGGRYGRRSASTSMP